MSEQFITEVTMICVFSVVVPIIGMAYNYPFKGVLKERKLQNFEGFFALTMGDGIGSLIGILTLINY